MYRCEECGCVVPPGTTAIKQVVETREREYPDRRQASDRRKKPAARRRRSFGDPGGCGREIVREQQICPACDEARVDDSSASEPPDPPAA